MPLLHPGDTFPELTLTVPGVKAVTVPESFVGQFSVVLFYRGAWCPCCSAQLRAFQRASATRAEHGLAFPVAFGADARAVADLTGAFVNPDPVYPQSAGFVRDPAGGLNMQTRKSPREETVVDLREALDGWFAEAGVPGRADD